jgi:hypothetical protein
LIISEAYPNLLGTKGYVVVVVVLIISDKGFSLHSQGSIIATPSFNTTYPGYNRSLLCINVNVN